MMAMESLGKTCLKFLKISLTTMLKTDCRGKEWCEQGFYNPGERWVGSLGLRDGKAGG